MHSPVKHLKCTPQADVHSPSHVINARRGGRLVPLAKFLTSATGRCPHPLAIYGEGVADRPGVRSNSPSHVINARRGGRQSLNPVGVPASSPRQRRGIQAAPHNLNPVGVPASSPRQRRGSWATPHNLNPVGVPASSPRQRRGIWPPPIAGLTQTRKKNRFIRWNES